MGSVQKCFSWELVAASIIWRRLQLGVTFVLQDGWLGVAWTLLTPSHRWASRRGYKRHTFRRAAVAKMRRNLRARCNVILLFNIFIKFKLCVRYWNIYTAKTHLEKNPILWILSLLGLQLRSCRLLRQMKNVSLLLQRWWYASLIDPHCSVSFWSPCII